MSKDQLDRILKYIDIGKKEGARLGTGGARHGDKGYYVQPTVFHDVEDHHTVSEPAHEQAEESLAAGWSTRLSQSPSTFRSTRFQGSEQRIRAGAWGDSVEENLSQACIQVIRPQVQPTEGRDLDAECTPASCHRSPVRRSSGLS